MWEPYFFDFKANFPISAGGMLLCGARLHGAERWLQKTSGKESTLIESLLSITFQINFEMTKIERQTMVCFY